MDSNAGNNAFYHGTANMGELKVHGSSVDGPKTRRGQTNATGSLTNDRKLNRPQQDNTSTEGSGKSTKKEKSTFVTLYERSDLPIQVDSSGRGRSLKWKVDIATLDYHFYLPVFFDGIREKKEPYCTIALLGVHDLLSHGYKKVFPVIPQLIIPVKQALETRDHQILCKTIKIIRNLANLDVLGPTGETIKAGTALVPYYRQILPTFARYKNKNMNIGDGIEYSQMKQENLGDLISDTLEVLEVTGGEDALINIRYIIPTHESCIFN